MNLSFLFFFVIFFFLKNYLLANSLAYIDFNHIINNTDIGISISNKLEKLNNNNISLLNKEQELLNNERDEIKKIQNIISKEELSFKIDEFNKKLDAFNKKQNQMSTDFKNLRQLEISNLLKKINPIIERYMVDKKIDLIIKKENIYISKTEYDITKDVVNLINETIKD